MAASQETQEILLNVRVNNSDAINNIVAYTNEVEKLRAANKALAKDSKENTENAEKNARQMQANNEVIKKYSNVVRQLSKEIQNNINQEKYKEGSLKGLRAELSNLTSAYDELSEAERNAAEGVALRDKINLVTKQLKAAEESTQRYYRNVGNYENALSNVFGGDLANRINSVKAGLMNVRTASDLLGKTPVITILYALVSIFMALKNAMKNNEEQMNRLTQITQPFKVILDGLTRVVETLVGALATGLEYLVKWGSALADWITGTNEASAAVERYIALERERQQLVIDNRNLMVEQAQIEQDVAKLRAKAQDKETYSAKERLKYLNEAIERQGELARKQQEIAARELAVLEEEGERTKNNAEFEDKLAQARVKVMQAETNYQNFLREAVAQRAEFNNQIRESERKLTEEREKLREREIKTLDEAEEALINLITDAQTKESELLKHQTEKAVEELRKRLETEKNLTAQERDAINTIIWAKEEELQTKLNEINSKYATQRADQRAKEIEEQKKTEDDKLAFQLRFLEEGETNWKAVRLQQLDRERQTAIDEANKKGLDVSAIEAYYAEESKKVSETRTKEDIENEKAVVAARQQAFSASIQLLEAFGDNNKKFAQAAKMVALAEMLVNQGKAIGAGVAQAMSVPFPGNLAAIVTTTATILSTIASATKTIKAAKFAEGGLVTGEGTGTSDSIPAMLSNGESVINARATALYSPLLSAINESTGGAQIGPRGSGELINYNYLINGIARAVAGIRPVVSVQEINEVSDRSDLIRVLAQN